MTDLFRFLMNEKELSMIKANLRNWQLDEVNGLIMAKCNIAQKYEFAYVSNLLEANCTSLVEFGIF